MATKLNPRNSWWALALGGTPGESEEEEEQHRSKVLKLTLSAPAAPCSERSLTSGRLGRELRIKVESVIRSARRWLEGRVDFPAEQFLPRKQSVTVEVEVETEGGERRRTLTFQSMVLKN